MSKDDKDAEKVLRQLGFKPGQVFSEAELQKKIVEINGFPIGDHDFSRILDLIAESNIVEHCFRFVPSDELKKLRAK